MKTQIALRLDDSLVEVARREAGRQNRSLADLVESALTESLMMAPGERPILSVTDDDLNGIEALNDSGEVDAEETQKLRHLIAVARRQGDE
jgi:hypothetical protein